MIDSGLVDTFGRDGVVKVPGLLDAAEVEVARAGVERVLAEPGPRTIVASAPGDPGRFVEDFCRAADIAELAQIAYSPRIGKAMAELMGSRAVRFFHDHVLVKEPGTRQRTPWHQDQPYYNVDGTQTASAWIALDPVRADQSLEVVAASHHGPWLMPRTFLDGQARWFPDGALAELPLIDPESPDVRRFAVEPGDAIVFNFLSVHGAPGFAGPGRRRVLSLRYLGDDCRHAPRPWSTSPEFPGLADQLEAGDPFDHPLFPQVWPPVPHPNLARRSGPKI